MHVNASLTSVKPDPSELTEAIRRLVAARQLVATDRQSPPRVTAATILIAKLSLATQKLRQHYDAAGTLLIYYLGHWRFPDEEGVWRPLSRLERQELDRAMRQAAQEAGLTWKQWMPRHFRTSNEFYPPCDGKLFDLGWPNIKISDERRG